MKKNIFLFISLLPFSIASFSQVMVKNRQVVNSADFISSIKKAHHFDLFYQQKAISFDIEMIVGGKTNLNATLTTLTSSGKIRLQNATGKTVIFDGKKTYLSPANADYPKARFDIFTYQYFFMAPFKVSDKGTQWEMLSDQVYNYNDYARARLTFQNGTGDSSNDWYIVHRNKATNYMEALAYIVTYGGKPVSEAEKKISSIFYSDWKAVGGVMFATTWKFMNWSEEKGFFGTKAEIKIKNIRFITPDNNTFVVPADSKEVGM
jgi:hypothetical protein